MSKKKETFIEKKWHGKPMYDCQICPWSTLSLDEIEKHVAKHIADATPKPRRVDTGLVGPGGGKIVREEVVEPEEPAEEESDG